MTLRNYCVTITVSCPHDSGVGIAMHIRFYKEKKNKFPAGWDEKRVKRILDHYENQSEDEAVAEDEAAWDDTSHTFSLMCRMNWYPPSGI